MIECLRGFSVFLIALLRPRSGRRGFSNVSKRTFMDPDFAVIPYNFYVQSLRALERRREKKDFTL